MSETEKAMYKQLMEVGERCALALIICSFCVLNLFEYINLFFIIFILLVILYNKMFMIFNILFILHCYLLVMFKFLFVENYYLFVLLKYLILVGETNYFVLNVF